MAKLRGLCDVRMAFASLTLTWLNLLEESGEHCIVIDELDVETVAGMDSDDSKSGGSCWDVWRLLRTVA
jgi:hypothetical protein